VLLRRLSEYESNSTLELISFSLNPGTSLFFSRYVTNENGHEQVNIVGTWVINKRIINIFVIVSSLRSASNSQILSKIKFRGRLRMRPQFNESQYRLLWNSLQLV
jgi:hypothetical protein